MDVVRTAASMRSRADVLRSKGRTLVLVPTMGKLHKGHLALVTAARQHGDHVTVSIFVNPTQFSAGEDFADYPRDLARDCALLKETGIVDAVFAPPVAELYPRGQDHQDVWVQSELLAKHLCGPHRPGHFTGVLTVVAKLFNCCKPHVSIFGLKDAQQFFMIRKLSEDLVLGVKIVGLNTVREADGLALSSRNTYLSPTERVQSVVLSQSVLAARQAIEMGEQRPDAVRQLMERTIGRAPAARLEYAEVVSTRDLQPVDAIVPGEEILAAVAVHFGNARLIDNVIVRAPAYN